MECEGWEVEDWETAGRAGVESGGSSLRRERRFDISYVCLNRGSNETGRFCKGKEA
jgi:hypothetical protein